MSKKIAVLSTQERQKAFGTFTYKEMAGGRIQIDSRWVADNLVECHLAKASGKGKDVLTQCHRHVKEPLERAFEEIAARGLWNLIHTFDGLWVPRHMTWNSSRPLSSHSWAIAFDLNAATNPYGGGVSAENRALNEVFSRYGFAWGGDWKRARDGMHWEMADLEAWQRVNQPKVPRLIVAVDRGSSFSYHALKDAVWQGDHFEVDVGEVARVLSSTGKSPNAGGGVVPLRGVLTSLGARVLEIGDHADDIHDPRYYVFLRPGKQASIPSKVVSP